MKILFIIGEFPFPSETFILNQITGLIDLGHEVDIYSSRVGDTSFVHRDIERYNLLAHTLYRRMPRRKLFRFLKGFFLLSINCLREPLVMLRCINVSKYGWQALSFRLLYDAVPFLQSTSSYDIIHCHFGPNGIRGAFLRDIRMLKGKLITTFHGYDITKYLNRTEGSFYKYLFSAGDLFLPISSRWKSLLIELGCEENKTLVHRMGIDCGKFSFMPRTKPTDGRVCFVSIARLVEKKGLAYSIRAVARLSQIYKNVQYLIVGDGPLKQDLQRLIEQLQVSDKVILLGWKHQDQVIDILGKAHILLAPSVTAKDGDQEGIPITLMEAMAMGLPVVSTLHSGIPELVKDGISGFLLPERDVRGLFQKIKYLVEHPEVWREIGHNARKHVLVNYDINKLNNRLVQIYQRVLN